MMSPIWLCWPTASEADGGGTAVEAEPSHQCLITFSLLYNRLQQRGSLSDIGVHVEQTAGIQISPREKHCPHWHPSTLAECLQRPKIGGEHSEAVGGGPQQWWQRVTSAGADIYKWGMPALVHLVHLHQQWRWLCWKAVFWSWEFALWNSVIVLFCIWCIFLGNK